MNKKRKIRLCREDRQFYFIGYGIVFLLTLIVLYPIVYVVASSFSSGTALMSGAVWLWPVDFSVEGYKAVLGYSNVWIGYRNTIFYTVCGTLINIAMTLICAYPLARRTLRGRKVLMFLFTFTMLFGGGMIPSYILMRNLHLLNTVWAMLLPGAMSVYNMIVARTFIQNNIPEELLDSARMDGCNDTRFFFQIVLPLSKSIVAVLALWYAVGHWNSYFNAFLYLTDNDLYPLQIFLKEILVQSQMNADIISPDISADIRSMYLVLKYAMIVISTAPLFVVYPFIQKYFVKGVMVGSVKG